MIVVDEADELLQNLWDIPGMILEKGAVPNTYFHILELDSRVIKRCNSFAVISHASTSTTSF
jgi:hypothetical protein